MTNVRLCGWCGEPVEYGSIAEIGPKIFHNGECLRRYEASIARDDVIEQPVHPEWEGEVVDRRRNLAEEEFSELMQIGTVCEPPRGSGVGRPESHRAQLREALMDERGVLVVSIYDRGVLMGWSKVFVAGRGHVTKEMARRYMAKVIRSVSGRRADWGSSDQVFGYERGARLPRWRGEITFKSLHDREFFSEDR